MNGNLLYHGAAQRVTDLIADKNKDGVIHATTNFYKAVLFSIAKTLIKRYGYSDATVDLGRVALYMVPGEKPTPITADLIREMKINVFTILKSNYNKWKQNETYPDCWSTTRDVEAIVERNTTMAFHSLKSINIWVGPSITEGVWVLRDAVLRPDEFDPVRRKSKSKKVVATS